MNSREECLKYIIREISTWKSEIELRGDINLYDSHILAQHHVMRLMNIVFGYQLHELDSETRNQAAIDLGDDVNKIAVQVTADTGRKKIEGTIDKFNNCQFYKRYNELYFFILKRKGNYRKGFVTQGLFEFNPTKHILDFRILIREINMLDSTRLKEIAEYLSQEISMSNEIEQRDLIIFLQYHPETELGSSYIVKLINRGRRPITVVDVFLNLISGGKISYKELMSRYIQLSTPLPQTLLETEFTEFLFPLYHMNELKGNEITSPLDIVSVTVLDSLDHAYDFPTMTPQSQDSFSQLRRLIQQRWEKND